MSDYGDIFGRYTDATGIMREFWADEGDGDLAAWLRDQSRALWGADHREEDWGELAAQVRADSLHGDWTIEDVAAGWANIVRCPECGAMEIWSIAEASDHGKCRSRGDACPACGR